MTKPLAVEVTVTVQELERDFRVSHAITSRVHLLRLTVGGDGGPHGVGEISADAAYGQDASVIERQARSIALDVAAMADVAHPAAIESRLEEHGSGACGPARLLVEMAILDRAARKAGQPVWRLLGLPDPGRVQLLHTVPMGEDAAVAARPLKVKLGDDQDAEIIASLVGRKGPILLDVNEGWDRSAWNRVANLVEQLAPAVLEDPTADPSLLGEIRERLPATRVVLDESVHDQLDVERAARLADGANIKVMRIGGLFPAIRSLRYLQERGLTRMLGSFLEPARAIAYAAQLNGLVDWADLDGHFWITRDRPVMHYRLNSSCPGIPEIAYDSFPVGSGADD